MVCFACGILSLILALPASLALQVLGRGDGSLLLQLGTILSILVDADKLETVIDSDTCG